MAGSGEVPAGQPTVRWYGMAPRLPFAASAFDRMVAAEVLEHIADDSALSPS